MYVTEEFLKVKKDKDLNAVIVFDSIVDGKQKSFIRFCLQVGNKYNDDKQSVFKEFEVVLNYRDYSFLNGYDSVDKERLKTSCYMSGGACNSVTQTFLRSIKNEKTQVGFEVVINNAGNWLKEAGLTRHEIYGLVNENRFLLEVYVGRQNSASPIQW